MTFRNRKYYEFRPGLDTARYLVSYGFLSWLAKRAAKRPHRLFTELTSGIDRHILSEGLFEKGVLDLLADVIAATGHTELMIDVGANIGNHTVALARLFKQVESVEPHPVLYRILRANVLRNGLGHVTCHNFGLAGEDARGTLAEPANNHSIARVKERSQLAPEVFGLSSEEFGNEFAIDLKSTHSFFSQFLNKLDRAFIKIDVEGMEQEIITAMVPLLEQYKPLVGFEWFTKSQPELGDIVANLKGYELWGIRMHDIGPNLMWRAAKLIFTGRSYKLERLDLGNLDEVYPLAMLVPTGRLAD
jgi:FkbM family methyltransferase